MRNYKKDANFIGKILTNINLIKKILDFVNERNLYYHKSPNYLIKFKFKKLSFFLFFLRVSLINYYCDCYGTHK